MSRASGHGRSLVPRPAQERSGRSPGHCPSTQPQEAQLLGTGKEKAALRTRAVCPLPLQRPPPEGLHCRGLPLAQRPLRVPGCVLSGVKEGVAPAARVGSAGARAGCVWQGCQVPRVQLREGAVAGVASRPSHWSRWPCSGGQLWTVPTRGHSPRCSAGLPGCCLRIPEPRSPPPLCARPPASPSQPSVSSGPEARDGDLKPDRTSVGLPSLPGVPWGAEALQASPGGRPTPMWPPCLRTCALMQGAPGWGCVRGAWHVARVSTWRLRGELPVPCTSGVSACGVVGCR